MIYLQNTDMFSWGKGDVDLWISSAGNWILWFDLILKFHGIHVLMTTPYSQQVTPKIKTKDDTKLILLISRHKDENYNNLQSL